MAEKDDIINVQPLPVGPDKVQLMGCIINMQRAKFAPNTGYWIMQILQIVDCTFSILCSGISEKKLFNINKICHLFLFRSCEWHGC